MDDKSQQPTTEAGIGEETSPKTVHQFTVEDERVSVDIAKVISNKGERIAICVPENGTSIRLDALALESLSWQVPDTIRNFQNKEEPEPTIESLVGDSTVTEASHHVSVTNEFAIAEISKVERDGKERAEINGPKKGTSLHLDATALAAITRQEMDIVSGFLETPAGPE